MDASTQDRHARTPYRRPRFDPASVRYAPNNRQWNGLAREPKDIDVPGSWPDSPPRAPSSRILETENVSYDIIKPLKVCTSNNAGEYLIEDRSTRTLYVEKRLSMSRNTSRDRAQAERDALLQIKHVDGLDHISRIVSSFYDGVSDYSSLILEYCDYGTMENSIDRYIRDQKVCPEGFAWHVFESITSALCVCHYGSPDPLMQRPRDWAMLSPTDIRPENVYLTFTDQQSAYPRIVLGNFTCFITQEEIDSGLAERIPRETPQWLPPEYRAQEVYPALGKFTDIWQLGALIQCICRLTHTPDQNLADEERPCGSRYSAALNNLITCCMQNDLRNRPNAAELLSEIHKTTEQRI